MRQERFEQYLVLATAPDDVLQQAMATDLPIGSDELPEDVFGILSAAPPPQLIVQVEDEWVPAGSRPPTQEHVVRLRDDFVRPILWVDDLPDALYERLEAGVADEWMTPLDKAVFSYFSSSKDKIVYRSENGRHVFPPCEAMDNA